MIEAAQARKTLLIVYDIPGNHPFLPGLKQIMFGEESFVANLAHLNQKFFLKGDGSEELPYQVHLDDKVTFVFVVGTPYQTVATDILRFAMSANRKTLVFLRYEELDESTSGYLKGLSNNGRGHQSAFLSYAFHFLIWFFFLDILNILNSVVEVVRASIQEGDMYLKLRISLKM